MGIHTKNVAVDKIVCTCTIQSTPGMSSPRAATSVQRRIPLEIDVKDANAFSLADF